MATGGESDDLSSEQTENVLHFQDLTGIEDITECRAVLERHNWDMEVAVQTTFAEREGQASAFEPPPPSPPVRPAREPQVDLAPPDMRAVSVARRPTGVFGWLGQAFLFPFRLVYYTVFDIFSFVLSIFRPDPRLAVTDPVGDVMNFIENFQQQYGGEHPVFYQGSYSQALSAAKQELRFLLVFLHDDKSRESCDFCRTTIVNEDFRELCNTRLLFWACSTQRPEGFKVSRSMRCRRQPFLGLIALRDNQMVLALRIDGAPSTAEVLERLDRAMANNEPALVAARADRQNLQVNRTIVEEQNVAYLQSLRADQEKEKRRQECLEKQREEEEAREREEREKQSAAEALEQRKQELSAELPEEPSPSDPSAVKIVMKLPCGTRLERRFDKSLSSKYLYYWVLCEDSAPDNFIIRSNFPRRDLNCKPCANAPDPPSLAELGLAHNQMLFVNDEDA